MLKNNCKAILIELIHKELFNNGHQIYVQHILPEYSDISVTTQPGEYIDGEGSPKNWMSFHTSLL